jgi:hypothetical protein
MNRERRGRGCGCSCGRGGGLHRSAAVNNGHKVAAGYAIIGAVDPIAIVVLKRLAIDRELHRLRKGECHLWRQRHRPSRTVVRRRLQLEHFRILGGERVLLSWRLELESAQASRLRGVQPAIEVDDDLVYCTSCKTRNSLTMEP